MPSLSLNVGLNNGRKLPFTSGAAPSGIVAATAGNLIISFGFFGSGLYSKESNVAWSLTFGEGEQHTLTYGLIIPSTWLLEGDYGGIRATNPSVNPLIIPTTGWTYIAGEGPAVTITAA